jgi:NAD(P)-dependent dehydrogenase (short-subunit alcohol dehydrogenase family)
MGRYGVRVNTVAPKIVRTRLVAQFLDERALDDYASRIALGQIAEAQDVADAICFLLSEEARYVSGETLYLTGGGNVPPWSRQAEA